MKDIIRLMNSTGKRSQSVMTRMEIIRNVIYTYIFHIIYQKPKLEIGKWKFWHTIEILPKNRNFDKTIKIFANNRQIKKCNTELKNIFHLNIPVDVDFRLLTKIWIFIKNLKFCQKSKFSIIEIFLKNPHQRIYSLKFVLDIFCISIETSKNLKFYIYCKFSLFSIVRQKHIEVRRKSLRSRTFV